MSEAPDFGYRADFYTFAPESLTEALPDYEILREVGKGSMGIVYEALERAGEHRRVALKVLPPSLTLTERALARFTREGEIMARIRHPGIVAVYGQGHGRRHDRLHYFAMEFVDGTNLDDRLRTGPLPAKQAAEIGRQAAQALQFAHDRGVVHRDIKPSNLILREDGRVAVTDFGLARETGTGSMTESGAIVGTPMFMAPEQISGDRLDMTSHIDVYGLGATLYTLVTGRPPFEGPNAQQVLRRVLDTEPQRPSKLSHDVPRDLEAIILTALDKDPTRRYATAAALGDDLARFLAGERVHARVPGSLVRLRRLASKHRFATALVALVVALALSALWLQRHRRRGEIDAQIERAGGLVAQAISPLDSQLKPLDEPQRRRLLQTAITTATDVLERDSSMARAWFVRAQAHHQLGQYRQCCLDLDAAERAAGGPSPEILHYRIDALGNLRDAGSRTQLYRDLRNLLEIEPSPYNRCIVAFHLVDLARSLAPGERGELLDRALGIVGPVPEPDAQVAVIRARILELRGLQGRALRAIRAAAEEFHGNPLVHDEAAAMLHRRGLFLEGEEHAELARIIDPKRADDAPASPAPTTTIDSGEVQAFLRDLQGLIRGKKVDDTERR